MGSETDRNGLQWVPKRTGTDFSSDQKRTSMGTRKDRMGYDRNDPNKVMYELVGRNLDR